MPVYIKLPYFVFIGKNLPVLRKMEMCYLMTQDEFFFLNSYDLGAVISHDSWNVKVQPLCTQGDLKLPLNIENVYKMLSLRERYGK